MTAESVELTSEMLVRAAAGFQDFNLAIRAASMAVAAPTCAVESPAADPVSMWLARRFSALGQNFQAVSAEVSAQVQQMVKNLDLNAQSYVNTED